MPSATAASSRQSPGVMSPAMPPLAAMMAAIRRSDRSRVTGLACSVSHSRRSAAKPPGSRVRAISAVSSCSPESASSQPRPGLITSPQISRRSPPPRPCPCRSLAQNLPAAAEPVAGEFPPAGGPSAPEADQRSCQVLPGMLSSQSSMCCRLRARSRCDPRLPRANGAASRRPVTWSRPFRVAGHSAALPRGGNCRSTSAESGAGNRPEETSVQISDGPAAAVPLVTGHPRKEVFSDSGR